MTTDTLTKRQEEILEGLLLGDGHLSIGGRAINPRLRINRAAADHDYQEWIRDEFAEICSEKSLSETSVYDERYGKEYGRSTLCTRRSSKLKPFYDRWYGSGARKLPPEITLTPLVVAVWFADDGSLFDRKSQGGVEVKLATASFGKEGTERLAEMLNQILGTSGFRTYGGYPTQPHYRIMGSTEPARLLIKYIRSDFPTLPRKVSWWSGPDRFIDPDYVRINCPCPMCMGTRTFKNGRYRERQRFFCNDCRKGWKA